MKNIIFVTGGVISSLGKGIYSASIARLLVDQGLKVNMMKCDPYLNVDPGTMSPIEHGEVFVTYDGGETDLDIGHYERFLGNDLSKYSSLTSGKVYSKVLKHERDGGYLGKTVQVIPHITDAIKLEMLRNIEDYDLLFVEVGGVVGDIESLPYIEAIRQLMHDSTVNTFLMHLTYVPYIKVSKELKTKPTQRSVQELQGLGIRPNMIVTRNEVPLGVKEKEKISKFCNVLEKNVIQNLDVNNVYELPLKLKEQGVDQIIIDHFKLEVKTSEHIKLQEVSKSLKAAKDKKIIGIIGKYTQLEDSYKSVIEAIKHAAISNNIKPEIKLIKSQDYNEKELEELDAIIVPGGFGHSGIDGKIKAIKYARENDIPFLGICLGMQLAVLEFARNVCNLDVNHEEIDEAKENNIITLMNDQNIGKLGGTLRLGNYECTLQNNTLIHKLYNKNTIVERHRHRYEFNNQYKEDIIKAGLIVSGINSKRNLVESVENINNKYFVAVQFHPEFTSKLTNPNPLFLGLLRATKEV